MKILGIMISCVIFLHILAMISWFGFGHDSVKGLVPLLHMQFEQNLPTYFSSFQLLVAAMLLGICAYDCKLNNGRRFWHWVGLALIFVFLSFDETAEIHERFSVITANLLGTSGNLKYAWVIPFGLFAAVVLVTYFRFLLNLPRKIGWIFFMAGGIYVFGAAGLEVFESRLHEDSGTIRTFEYMNLVTIEETLEILGVYLFIFGLLAYLTHNGRRLGITLSNSPPGEELMDEKSRKTF